MVMIKAPVIRGKLCWASFGCCDGGCYKTGGICVNYGTKWNPVCKCDPRKDWERRYKREVSKDENCLTPNSSFLTTESPKSITLETDSNNGSVAKMCLNPIFVIISAQIIFALVLRTLASMTR